MKGLPGVCHLQHTASNGSGDGLSFAGETMSPGRGQVVNGLTPSCTMRGQHHQMKPNK